MNHLLIAAFILISVSATAQQKDTTHVVNWLAANSTWKGFKHDTAATYSLSFIGSNKKPNTFVEVTRYIFIKDGSTIFFKYMDNGDVYYLPSAFCQCDTCKSHKGLKFLFNIYKP
jgi:hypothetical protein